MPSWRRVPDRHELTAGTIERAKADPLTCYAPPLNTLALLILLPFRYCSPPRVLHKVQVYLARLLNLPVLLFLALHTRAMYHKKSSLFLATQRTSRLLAKIPRTVLGGMVPMLEGSVERVAKEVFERRVTEQGRAVASIDAITPPITATATANSSSGPGKGASTSRPRNKDRTGSLGSLNSPLARIFGQQASLGAGHHAQPGAGDQNLENRLARIEEALQILVGEVVKSSPGAVKEQDGEPAALDAAEPLKDLSGRTEEL